MVAIKIGLIDKVLIQMWSLTCYRKGFLHVPHGKGSDVSV